MSIKDPFRSVPDCTEHPIADCAAPIRDENGEIIGVVLVFRDQSEKRAAQKALREPYEELQETHRRAAFLADLVEKTFVSEVRHI